MANDTGFRAHGWHQECEEATGEREVDILDVAGRLYITCHRCRVAAHLEAISQRHTLAEATWVRADQVVAAALADGAEPTQGEEGV